MSQISTMKLRYRYLFLSLSIFLSLFCMKMRGEERAYFLDLPQNCTEESTLALGERIDNLVTNEGINKLHIRFHSTKGSLKSSLNFAQKLASIRDSRRVEITAYIDTLLSGPFALVPFVADKIETTRRITWGRPLTGESDGLNKESFLLAKGIIVSLMPNTNGEPRDAWKGLLNKMTESSLSDHSNQYISQNELMAVPDIRVDKDRESFESQFVKEVPPNIETQEKRESPDHTFEKEFSKIALSPNSFIGRIFIGPKNDMISQSTWIYVKSALDYFKLKKPSCIIIELDTPGGEVFAAEKISDALKSLDYDHGIPVIAYINNWAISAGAMVSYSCRYIVTEQDGAMGAATPVMMSEEGMQPTSEKMISALRADFANKASLFGRNPYIAEAMVDPDVIVVEREGKIIKLSTEAEMNPPSFQGGGDIIISSKGKLLTLTGKDLARFSVANYVVPLEGKNGQLANTSIGTSFLQFIPYFQGHSDVPIETYQMDFRTSFVSFIASPVVTSALVFLLMVSLYMELSSPGVTVPGLVALVSFFFLMVGSYAQESIVWFEPLVALFGLILIVADIFLLPTGGFLSGLGTLCLFLGVIMMIVPAMSDLIAPIIHSLTHIASKGSDPSPEITMTAKGYYGLHVLSLVSLAIFLAVIMIILLAKYQIRPHILGRMHLVLDVPSPQVPSIKDDVMIGNHIPGVGDTGVVRATLRPAGKVVIGGELYDAISTGEFIQVDEPVRVVEIRGYMICVEKLNTDQTSINS